MAEYEDGGNSESKGGMRRAFQKILGRITEVGVTVKGMRGVQ